MTDIASLKKTRGLRKSEVSRLTHRLEVLLVEEDEDQIEELLQRLSRAYHDFEDVHESVTATHEDPCSEENVAYMDSVRIPYIKLVKEAKLIIKKQKAVTVKASLTNLPPLTLPEFSGEPTSYPVFIRTFDELVDKCPIDEAAKLARLLQFCRGKALEAIKQCIYMSDGYSQAKAILHRRFGDPYLITEALLNDIKNGPSVRSPEDIRQLADKLQTTLKTLTDLNMLSEMESQGFILAVLTRFPGDTQKRYKKYAVNEKRTTGRYPSVTKFGEYIATEADDATDPIFGLKKVAEASPAQRQEKRKTQVQNAFTSNVSAPSAPEAEASTTPTDIAADDAASNKRICPYCGGAHKLRLCSQFTSEHKPAHERLEFAKTKNLCFLCLSGGHVAADCKSPYVCTMTGCGGKHSKFLHIGQQVAVNDQVSGAASERGERDSSAKDSSRPSGFRASALNSRIRSAYSGAYIPTVRLKVQDNIACAILDTGSDATFCSARLADQLQQNGELTPPYEPITCSISLGTLHGHKTFDAKILNFEAKSLDGSESLMLNNVIVIDEIPIEPQPEVPVRFNHLEGLNLCSGSRGVDLLIGQDNAEALIPMDVRRGEAGQPYGVRTLFGWSLNGPRSEQVQPIKTCHFVSKTIDHNDGDKALDAQLAKWWEVETEGLALDKRAHSVHDRNVLEYWDRECILIDDHFQLPIPWRPEADLPNNRTLALHRLEGTERRLSRQGLLNKYKGEIDKLVANGFCEPAPSQPSDPSKVWYLPHHAVINPKKPEKLRIVFDCAAKYKGESLNDKCFSGPDLNNRLLHVLIRFRQHVVAFCADVEAMYYQVLIPAQERDALRFLWRDDSGSVVEYRMSRHVFGGVWSASSATYALRKSIELDSCVSESVSNAINKSFYVDDCLQSAETEEQAVHVALGTKQTLMHAGFKLTKFISNSELLMTALPDADQVPLEKRIDVADGSSVLGVKWHPDADLLTFECTQTTVSHLTRRMMLSFISSLFDPLGLAAPMMVRGKLLMQRATRMKLAWDAPVPPEIMEDWNEWLSTLNDLGQLQVPRCIKPFSSDSAHSELHHFSDASEAAYGCCSYLRSIDAHGNIHVALIMSKGRIAPMKQLSIPRLELEAAVMAAKIDVMLREQIEIEVTTSFFWVDSEVVLKYIANESSRFQTYISNRLSIIQSVSDPNQWHHIRGEENVADIVSRGHSVINERSILWFSGPAFLRTHKAHWPMSDPDLTGTDGLELKRTFTTVVQRAPATEQQDEAHPLDRLIGHFSDFFRLKRATAWLIRFTRSLKSKIFKSESLSFQEINYAENVLIKHVQSHDFSDEIRRLEKGMGVISASKIKSLDPFLDDEGILRVGGRLRRASPDQLVTHIHPVLISHKNSMANLIAAWFHKQAHLGTEWVISHIRSKFWITHARSVVKRAQRNCVTCRRLFAAPATQKMADLPRARIESHVSPFTNVGLDCFGPMTVKRGRSEVKRYGAIFCCFQTRAVHLEMLDTMDTDSLINALRRFIARRGQPSKMFSDNGTNLIGARNALFTFDENMIKEFSLSQNIEWNFQPPHASHMGGVWERLIRVTRKVMAGLLPMNIRLTDESLRTLLCEAERVINTRPLTKVSADPSDGSVLTPNHLLLLNNCSALAPCVTQETDKYRQRWRCVQHLASQFWKKWLAFYLPELQRRQKWLKSNKDCIKLGDVVLLVDESVPRGVWPMGLVTEVKHSDDGLIRSATVRLKTGAQLRRPLTKIVNLECT